MKQHPNDLLDLFEDVPKIAWTTHDKVPYNPKYCIEVLDLASAGYSNEEIRLFFAHVHGIQLKTFYVWKREHPDFREALESVNDLSRGWWLAKGRKSIVNNDINPRMYEVQLNNRFDKKPAQVQSDSASSDEWLDKLS